MRHADRLAPLCLMRQPLRRSSPRRMTQSALAGREIGWPRTAAEQND